MVRDRSPSSPLRFARARVRGWGGGGGKTEQLGVGKRCYKHTNTHTHTNTTARPGAPLNGDAGVRLVGVAHQLALQPLRNEHGPPATSSAHDARPRASPDTRRAARSANIRKGWRRRCDLEFAVLLYRHELLRSVRVVGRIHPLALHQAGPNPPHPTPPTPPAPQPPHHTARGRPRRPRPQRFWKPQSASDGWESGDPTSPGISTNGQRRWAHEMRCGR